MKRVICILLIFCFILSCIGVAAAAACEPSEIRLRAGGGGGSGGGGGGGGGGRGGSSHSGSGRAPTLLESILQFVMMPLVFFSSTILFYIKLTKRARKSKKLMKQMMQGDAAWKFKNISAAVNDSFYAIQKAWAEMDMSPAEKYMSDELYANFKMKLSWMAYRNQKNVLEKISLLQALPVAVHDDGDDARDFVWFYIKGRMVDYIIDTETLMKVSGSTSPVSFVEYWKFTRKENDWVLSQILQKNEADQIPFSE